MVFPLKPPFSYGFPMVFPLKPPFSYGFATPLYQTQRFLKNTALQWVMPMSAAWPRTHQQLVIDGCTRWKLGWWCKRLPDVSLTLYNIVYIYNSISLYIYIYILKKTYCRPLCWQSHEHSAVSNIELKIPKYNLVIRQNYDTNGS